MIAATCIAYGSSGSSVPAKYYNFVLRFLDHNAARIYDKVYAGTATVDNRQMRFIHKKIYTHTYIYTYIYTHTYIYIYIYIFKEREIEKGI